MFSRLERITCGDNSVVIKRELCLIVKIVAVVRGFVAPNHEN